MSSAEQPKKPGPEPTIPVRVIVEYHDSRHTEVEQIRIALMSAFEAGLINQHSMVESRDDTDVDPEIIVVNFEEAYGRVSGRREELNALAKFLLNAQSSKN